MLLNLRAADSIEVPACTIYLHFTLYRDKLRWFYEITEEFSFENDAIEVLKCDKLEMNQTTLMKKSSLAPPTAYFFIPLLSFLSRWNIFRWQWRRLTQSERQQLTSRPKEHKNKQCVTEPLSLLYYFFIGKFTISNEIKKSFLSDYCFFLSFFFFPRWFTQPTSSSTAPNSNFICK